MVRLYSKIQTLFIVAFGVTMASCSAPRLTVMSFNVRQSHVREADSFNSWDKRKDACAEMISAKMPDIVGFQEAQYKNQWSFFKNKFDSDYSAVGVGRDNGSDKGETTGFLYKKVMFELLDSGTFWQSETPDRPSICYRDMYKCPRSVTWALLKVKKSGREFIYINTHTAVDYYSVQQGLRVISEWLDSYNTKGYPVVMTGDFNSTPDNDVFKELRQRFNDARDLAPSGKTDSITTYNAWGKKEKAKILDYVWLTPGIKCLEYSTDTCEYCGHKLISDHFPISAIIKF